MTVSHGVADQCVFEPPGPIRRALAQARIMVIPSRAESLPYVILEAAAAAQPLIATDVGGIGEIYGPQHRHRLIPPMTRPSWPARSAPCWRGRKPSACARLPISPRTSAGTSGSTR